MQKTKESHPEWKHVEYGGSEKTAPQAESSHLDHLHAGQMSHKGHKAKASAKGKKEAVLVIPTESTSAFSWHMQNGLLGNSIGVSKRVLTKGQEVSHGFG